jgi:hypothetical protein
MGPVISLLYVDRIFLQRHPSYAVQPGCLHDHLGLANHTAATANLIAPSPQQTCIVIPVIFNVVFI